jgi:hypothetical protein
VNCEDGPACLKRLLVLRWTCGDWHQATPVHGLCSKTLCQYPRDHHQTKFEVKHDFKTPHWCAIALPGAVSILLRPQRIVHQSQIACVKPRITQRALANFGGVMLKGGQACRKLAVGARCPVL